METIFLCLLLCLTISSAQEEFRVANMFSSGMVFQREPHAPNIWGMAPPNTRVGLNISLGEEFLHVTDNVLVGEDGVWTISLGSWPAGVGYSVHIMLEDTGEIISLTDIAFGDVWVCSGQSNMVLKVSQARDSEKEIFLGAQYKNIRLLKLKLLTNPIEVDEVGGFDSDQWVKPTVEFLTAPSFSALCFFYGEQLYDELEVPIGLIHTAWGGTIVEAWSPPEVIEECGVEDEGTDDAANHNNYLWNAMVHPLTRMSIKGAIWYQGESNTGHNRDIYDCTFPAMIRSWRESWYKGTGGDTLQNFPFGFVQLAPNRDTVHLNWPILRWKQTGSFGHVPNELMENVFMAVAVDDDIDLHPKNKRLPATRLAWAASNLVYGNTDLPLQGPQVLKVDEESPEGRDIVTGINVTFSAALRQPALEEDRFMVCCMESMDLCEERNYGQEQGWQGVKMVDWFGGGNYPTTVVLDPTEACSGSGHFSGLAYLWREVPCSGEEACPLYSDDQYSMPVAPFKYNFV